MARHVDGYEIHEGSGLPREYVSCPHCGFVYGYQRRKVCPECQECSKCCPCPEPKPARVTGKEMIDQIVKHGL
jgi:hypothetical protein